MARAASLAQLAERELATLALIASGCSNEAIARTLHVSTKTVEAMCSAIFRKLDLVESGDVNRRVKAAVLYLKLSSSAPEDNHASSTAVGAVVPVLPPRGFHRSVRITRTRADPMCTPT